MLDILSIIPRKKRQTPSGWIVFDGICCHQRGHNPDKRSRAGIKFSDTTTFSYHCFNCGFKCSFQLGRHFSKNLKTLLTWCGLDSDKINKLSFESFSQRSLLDLHNKYHNNVTKDFKEIELPNNARPLNITSDTVHVNYILGRGLDPEKYTYYVVDNEVRERLIIPFYYKGKIVGYTSRYYDNRHPKYISESQSGYLFNIDGQKDNWNVCIVVEGQFDALSIDGCAFMGNHLNENQIQQLRSLNKKVVVVPDRDHTGLQICDKVLEEGFYISIPNWDKEVKDVNDAVKRYGKLPTLLSILENATTSKIKVEMSRKKII